MTTNLETLEKKQNFLISLIQKPPQKLLRPTVAVLFLLVLWQVVCNSPESSIPSPWRTFQDSKELIFNPFFNNGGIDVGLFWQIFASLQRVAVGFTLSAIVGIAIGILIGSNEFMYDALDPIFQVLRTIPPLAWLPIALAGFQQANPSSIFVIFITAIWPIIINTTVGVKQIPQDYKNVAKVLRLSGWKYFTKVMFPSSVPYIFTGLRIGIGLSWLAIIAAEMLVGGVGIGFFIWDAYNSSRLSHIIIALLYVGVVGLLLDRMVDFIASLVVSQDQAR
jgi:nitrate/nitrite transport system permease protein